MLACAYSAKAILVLDRGHLVDLIDMSLMP